MQWNVTNNFRLRAAAFRVVKPALANNRTLEPTQVAGFNQLYDDINGTKSETGAAGVDWRISRNLAVGAEYTSRNMEEPIYDNFLGNWISEDRQEKNGKLYLYWTPTERLAFRVELIADRYTSDVGIDPELPLKVATNSLPVGITYFGTSGLFVGATATYVDQEVQRQLVATKASGDDQFTVVDAAIGYRFANRRGMVSLGVKNLFDRRFSYQDDSYREFRTEPSVGPYYPVRTVLGRVALTF